MDLLTHGLLGAATAQLAARDRELRVAAGVGAAAALLPDADALIRSSTDPLFFIEYHRHFTHALLFIPVGALIAALLLWPLLRGRLPFVRIYVFALLGYALHGLLDACTSYGTHLLWPLSDARAAWSIVAVMDPAFTLLVGIPTLIGIVVRRRYAAVLALFLGAAYLTAGVVQHHRALHETRAVAQQRGHDTAFMTVKPTMANLLLWRSIYVSSGNVYVDAVRVGSGGTMHYPGESAPLIVPEQVHRVPAGSRAHTDVMRFAFFSDGLLTPHPSQALTYGDARYSMLPDSLRPIWSVRVDPARPDAHVAFLIDRSMTADERRRFLAMLRGRPLDTGTPAP
jgi:inner membrane protein